MKPLPRDARDTLFLLTLIGWTVAPHLLHQPPWLAVVCASVLLWRGAIAWRQAPLPGRWSLLALLGLIAGLTWWSQRTLLGKDAGVILLVSLMALKTLELRARRDAMLLFFLGFFLVLTNFLYSQTLLTALAMGVSVWGWLTALTLAHMPAGRPPLREAGALAARAALVGTPVMLALFLLFPRMAPLWAMPGESARTGLSDHLGLGDVAELALDDSVALRLRFAGRTPGAAQLYLRGPVLERYDGRQWRTGPSTYQLRDAPRGDETVLRGEPVDYEMTLEPQQLRWLPLLETTPAAPEGLPESMAPLLREDRGGQWRLGAPLTERVRLRARAWPSAQREPQLSESRRRAHLALPEAVHPRTRAWAHALQAQPALQGADTLALVRAVLQHIRREPFRYTLAPGSYEGDVVDAFWLDRRAGFCEHYAASFVVVMRAMGVPARIVTGYQGSDPAPVDGYLVVRQSQAHAWAEVWVAERGWQRVDPTAAVAPERIERGRALRPNPGLVAGTLDAVSPDLRETLRAWAEALDNRWNQAVLGYGRNEQFRLLAWLGWEDPDYAALGRTLGGLIAVVALAGAAWAALDARRRSPWQRLQGHIDHELRRLGLQPPAQADPGRLAQWLLQQRGEAARPAALALQELLAWRYGPSVGGVPQQRDRWRSWQRRFSGHCKALRAGSA